MVVINRYFGFRVFIIIFTMVVLAMAKTGQPTKTEETGSLGAAAAAGAVATGNCSCGGFATDAPAPGVEPLLAHSPLTVPCTPLGELTCRAMCVALTATTKAKGPQILCARLGNAAELKLAAFSKACEQPWSYSGMKAEEALCCVDSQVTQCASAALPAATAPPAPSTPQPAAGAATGTPAG